MLFLQSFLSLIPGLGLFVPPHDFHSHTTDSLDMKPSDNGLFPPQVPLDAENYPIAPAELALEQVHVYIRHGERTPVRVRMADPPASIPVHWSLCRTARLFRAAVATFGDAVQEAPRESDGANFLPVKRVLERADGTALEGECLLGELTDVGRQSTFNYGRGLRKLYVERLGFLPDTLHDNNTTYFRSTNVPRTVESLQQVIHGLYPRHKLQPGVTPHVRIRNGENENLIANTFACKRLEYLLVGFAQAAASAYNHTLEPLDAKLSKYIGGNPIRIDGKPRASGILDTIRAATAHGIEVPPEFREQAVMDLIERAVVTEWYADKTEEMRRLGMGRLLKDLEAKMQLATQTNGNSLPEETQKPSSLRSIASLVRIGARSGDEGESQRMRIPKLLVHSTHDTALAALLSTLDVFDEKWPAFTAAVTFELFSKPVGSTAQTPSQSKMQQLLGLASPFGKKPQTPPREHYVRMRYQNRSLNLPICSAPGAHLKDHPEFCTLSAFAARVRALAPESEAEWQRDCTLRPADIAPVATAAAAAASASVVMKPLKNDVGTQQSGDAKLDGKGAGVGVDASESVRGALGKK